MKAFLTTLASKRLWAAVASALVLVQHHQYYPALGVVVAYLAGETYRPTKPKGGK